MSARPEPANPALAAALAPDRLRDQEADETGLISVPLPDGRLPLSSIGEAVEAVVGAVPLDAEGQRLLGELESAVGFPDMPFVGLHELEGLALTHLVFGDGCLFLTLDWSAARWDLGGGLSIDGPVLSVERTPGAWSVAVGGGFTFAGLHLGLELAVPELELWAGLVEPARLGDLLAELHLDGSSLDDLQIATLSVSVSVPERRWAFSIAVGGGWHPFGEGSGPALDALSLDLRWQQGAGVEGELGAALTLGPLTFAASAAWSGAGWELSAELGEARSGDPPTLEDLVEAAASAFGLSVPGALPFEVALTSAGVALSTTSGHFEAWCDLEVEGVGLALSIVVERDAAGARSVTFGGHVAVAGLTLDLRYSQGSWLAVFADSTGHEVDLGAMVEDLLAVMGADDVPDLPEVTLSVRQVLFVALAADSGPGEGEGPPDGAAGGATEASPGGGKPRKRSLLLVDLDVGFDVGSLPLVGDIFTGDAELSVRFVTRYASQALTVDQVQQINGLLPPAASPLPGTAILPGGGFSASVVLGGTALVVPVGPSDATSGRAAARAPAQPKTLAPAGGPPGTHWVDLDQQVGPLSLARLGLGMEDGRIALVLDGGVALGPVQAAALGLGVTYDLDDHSLAPQLDGLAIAVEAGELVIKGGFLRTRSVRSGEGDTYAGLVDIAAPDLRIAAMGLYQEVAGSPTLFLYGYLGVSVGLRPLITVDGVALGFGYGRTLRPVTLPELPTFPLVEVAVGDAPPPGAGATGGGGGDDDASTSNAALEVLETLRRLQSFLPATPGGLVFAVGLKVGLLESLLDGFVLATVSISIDDPSDLTIQVFGAATATLPPQTPAGPWVARLELDLVARVRPMLGELYVGLTVGPGSYVVDPNAKLTGGMALAVWMAGAHAGDFVLSIGGYAPTFRAPAHYPVVPRVKLHWQVSDALQLKGELYAAITPRVFMAGGALSADFRAGKVQAWFQLCLDVLIRFKPFHYTFTATVSVGARYGSIGISASARLDVWGPEFSGKAHISVSLVLFSVSFNIAFGAKAPTPPPLTWAELAGAFLPPVGKRCGWSLVAGAQTVLEGERARGLHVGTDGRHYVVDAKRLVLKVVSAIPWGAVQAWPMSRPAAAGVPAAPATVESTLHLTVTRDGEPVDVGAVFDRPEPLEAAFPTAIWRGGAFSEVPGGAGAAPGRVWHTAPAHDPTVKLTAAYTLVPTPAPTPSASQRLRAAALAFAECTVPSRAPTAPPAATLGAPQLRDPHDGPVEGVWTSSEVRAARTSVLGRLGLDTRAHRILEAPLSGRGRRRPHRVTREQS